MNIGCIVSFSTSSEYYFVTIRKGAYLYLKGTFGYQIWLNPYEQKNCILLISDIFQEPDANKEVL